MGFPGIKIRWTHGSKRGVGTAYPTVSTFWVSLWNGVLTEIFYSTIDKIQTCQFILDLTKAIAKIDKKFMSLIFVNYNSYKFKNKINNCTFFSLSFFL